LIKRFSVRTGKLPNAFWSLAIQTYSGEGRIG
jgi:hypothetical protein